MRAAGGSESTGGGRLSAAARTSSDSSWAQVRAAPSPATRSEAPSTSTKYGDTGTW